MTEVILEQVRPENTAHVWVQVKPLLDRAIATSNGELTSEDLRRAVISGQAQLFVSHDRETVYMACATEFVTYPRYTTLRIIALGGIGSQNLLIRGGDFLARISAWALAQGATKVEACCHPGMVRLLRRFGFYQKYITVFRDVE